MLNKHNVFFDQLVPIDEKYVFTRTIQFNLVPSRSKMHVYLKLKK